MQSALVFGRLDQFHLEPKLEVGRGRYPARSFSKKRSEPAGAMPIDVSFGLLTEDDNLEPLGPRALEILIALLERQRESVCNQDLTTRVWPNVFVEPANIKVHTLALRPHSATPGCELLDRQYPPRLPPFVSCLGSRGLKANAERSGNSERRHPGRDDSRAAIHSV